MSRETPFPVGVVDNLVDKNDEHSTKKRPHNTTLGPESEHSRSHNTTLGSESELVGVLQKGYAMMCDFCGVENCRSGYNKPVLMVCYLCSSCGKHWPKNCPSGLYRGAPMPEQYGCFYWFNSNSTGA